VFTPFLKFLKQYWNGNEKVIAPSELKQVQGALDDRWKGIL
jgi:hypothetical protein